MDELVWGFSLCREKEIALMKYCSENATTCRVGEYICIRAQIINRMVKQGKLEDKLK